MINKNGNGFLAQFDNRVEKIGKDGYFGLIKQTTSPINSNNNISQFKYLFDKEYNNNLLLKYSINNGLSNQRYNNNPYLIDDKFNSPFSSLSQIYKIKNYKNFAHNNYRVSHCPLDMNFMDDNKNRKNNSVNSRNPLIYSCQINGDKYNLFKIENNLFNNNKHKIGDNRQNIIDNGYKSYTVKDYKKIDKEIDMGKLGADFGTKEWNEKRERMNKMKEYGNLVLINKNSQKMNFNNRYNFNDNNNINSNEKVRNSFDYNINYKNEEKIQPKDLIIKQHVNINYRKKLKKFKHNLF